MGVRTLLLLCLLSMPAWARPKMQLPSAKAVLLKTFSLPTESYKAIGRVQHYLPSKKAKGLTIIVYRDQWGHKRTELSKKRNGPIELQSIDNGTQHYVYWSKLSSYWSSPSFKERESQQVDRLFSLYEISLTTGGSVAKHTTWRLNFKLPNKGIRQSYWVDRNTGLLLKREVYGLDGSLFKREKFTKLETMSSQPSLFEISFDSAIKRGDLLVGIPDGFLPIEVTSGKILHYSDGLTTFDIEVVPGQTQTGLKFNNNTPTYAFKWKNNIWKISGDLTEDEMLKIADHFQGFNP